MATARNKRAHLIVAVCTALLSLAVPAFAYYFQGYYCPAVLVSPMHPNVMYSPVGMGIVTSRAGFRTHPVTGRADFHSGVDLGAHLNDRVYNLLDGIVTRVGVRGALGVAVEVYHPYPNVRTICGHLNAYAVLPGMYVQRGRVIGYAGSTGRSTGVHVHYTIIKNDTDQYVEPMQFLKLIPKYVSALATARNHLAMARNIEEMKKRIGSQQPEDTESEDLPAATKKASKPAEPPPTTSSSTLWGQRD